MDLVSDGIRWFIGPGLQALLMLCLLALRCQDKESAKEESMIGGRGRGWFLFRRKDDSEIYLENMEQTDLVAFNGQVSYDLGELLRASTFVLGKSGVGIVYKVVLEDGLTLAVRRLGEGGSQRFKEFQAEVKAIGRIRQCNIVTLRAYYWSVDDKLLIYDYIPNGSLVAALHGRLATSSPLLWVAHLKIAKSVAKGLAHIHECSPNKYIHGDLKPTNILLGLNMEPYIADFGLGHLASIAGSLSTREHVMIGTTHPERKLGLEAQSAFVPSMGFTTQGILISPGSSYRCSNMIRLQMDLT